jgi:hypothetical protein
MFDTLYGMSSSSIKRKVNEHRYGLSSTHEKEEKKTERVKYNIEDIHRTNL